MSLRTKLLMSLICVVIGAYLAVNALSLHFLNRAKQSMENGVQSEVDSLLLATSEAIALTFPSRDYAEVQEYVDDLMKRKTNIHDIEIFDENGDLAVKSGNPDTIASTQLTKEVMEQCATGKNEILSQRGSQLTMVGPLTFRVGQDVELYGYARITVNKGYLDREFAAWNRSFSALVVVLAVLSLAASYLFLSRWIVTPIRQLSQLVRSLTGEHQLEKITMPASGEVKTLVDSFNHMIADLQQTTVSRDRLAEEIDQRKKAEQAENISQTRYRQLFENMTSGVIVCRYRPETDTFMVTQINAATEKIEGVSRDDVLMRSLIDALPGDFAFELEKVMARVSASGLSERQMPTYYANQENASWRRSYVYPLPSGEIVAVYDDVTQEILAKKDLEATHQKLINASRQAGMSEVASGVLHNVGNVLNSVKVSVALVENKLKQTRLPGLSKAAETLTQQYDTSETESRNEQIAHYLDKLHETLQAEQQAILTEARSLADSMEHIENIIRMQQEYAKTSGVSEKMNIEEIVEDAIRMNSEALRRHRINLVRDFGGVGFINTEKHNVLQILTNLIRNAKYAIDEQREGTRQLTITTDIDDNNVCIHVKDAGIGIPAENMTKIFAHGFTTRKKGHGFGLHSSALAAESLGGSLTVQSDGPGEGATFTLTLPKDRDSSHQIGHENRRKTKT